MARTRQEIEALARETLAQHGLLAIPIDPVVLANRLGVAIYNAKFSEENLAGMLSRRGNNVTMLINESDPPYRKRFSIGHEIGHHLMHLENDGDMVDQVADMFRSATFDGTEDGGRHAEVEANQFAAALLMPAELVRTQWELTPSVAAMARVFNVSEEAMAIRLDTLRLA